MLSRSSRAFLRLGLALLAAGLLFFTACGGAEPPRWVPLARGFQPRPLLPIAQEWQRAAGLDPARCKDVLGDVQVEHPLARADWRADAPGLWSTALPGGAFPYGAPGFLRIAAGEQNLQLGASGRELEPGSFRLQDGRIVLRLENGEPQEGMVLSQHMESGRRASDGVWQVRLGGEFDAGIGVWSGLSEERECPVPAQSRLACEAVWASRGAAGPVVLRVRLDGELVNETRVDAAELSTNARSIVFALPPRARASARLAFEVEGPPGQLLLLHPILGPAEFGSYGRRPWDEARADIVLFLADTFRADNLAAYGGAPETAPNLNRFAAGARCFTNARSNAAWTLPSISSLLTGFAPGQHTANDTLHKLPAEIVTVAERLSRAGYRTGAITDAAFFTPVYGLDQGFETFRQHPLNEWNLQHTVENALEFLAHDDGRPVFLVVHTYRAHLPYRVGPDEDLSAWNALVSEGFGLLRGKKNAVSNAEWLRRLHASSARYRDLYRQGVQALDQGFGSFVEGLEARGLLARGTLIFTSDHGEALGENDNIFHAGDLWETKLRVPLLVRSPRFAPGTVASAVTLLDLAPTLAEIAGVPADPAWHGAALDRVPDGRPSFAFRLQKQEQITVVEGERKLFAGKLDELAQGRVTSAFELGGDPHEEHDVAGSVTWPAELARQRAELVDELERAVVDPSGADIGPDMQKQLRGLGYSGEEEK